ncbi:adenosylcobinamide-phosphate synthase CbiB [Maricurvus nonylphenolicus]|uniref:adenosylcobinamide-phosphate synthase CbiB n=1 Tax=Maricurvus nonylphenolicus TaxID=1008307 RepID=UPI0036F283D9
MNLWWQLPAVLLAALLLDKLLGEPRRFHPLVGFGHWTNAIEGCLNRSNKFQLFGFLLGACAWVLAVIPIVIVAAFLDHWLQAYSYLHMLVTAAVLYLAIGWQSLLQHAQAVAKPLIAGDLSSARQAVGMIVSRDPEQLDTTGVAKAATESVLENGADAIFSAIFWCVIAGLLGYGIAGVVLYRLANTLDAMWGYRNERFLQFGWAAARIDDLLNFIPARLTALSYTLMGNTRVAWQCWREQGYNWKSPNAGPVMASGAGALNVSLGGEARYHQQLQVRPALGPNTQTGRAPSGHTIVDACQLVNRALVLWVLVITALAVVL